MTAVEPVHPLGLRPLDRPRLGFLGTGWIGRDRLAAIAASGLAEIALVVDPSAERAAAALDQVPGARRAASFDELLRAPIDGLVIATPSALHTDQTVAALERGLAVFCQKPLGRNRAETERAVAAARAADRLLAVDLSYRFVTGVPELRALIRSGGLGDIYAIDLVFHNAWGPDQPWFYDRKQSGGGCVIDLGVHLIDLGLWVLDYPRVEGVTARRYSAGARLAGDDPRVEDFATAWIDLAPGATMMLACSWRLPAGQNAVIEASFYGTQGGASLRNRDGSFFDLLVERFHHTDREPLALPSADWGGRAAIDWVRRLAAGERYDPTIERIVGVADVLDRVNRG